MRAIATAFLLVVVLLPGAGRAAGPSFQDGLAGYEGRDFQRALAIWLPLAEAGDAEARYRVGRLHGEGEGVSKDEAVAAAWYRKAAEQGMPQAYSAIGLVYAYGQDERVPKDPAKEFEWYLEAAEKGQWASQASVARFLLEGKVVPGDAVEGLKWAIIANRSGRTSESVLKALGQIRMTKEARAACLPTGPGAYSGHAPYASNYRHSPSFRFSRRARRVGGRAVAGEPEARPPGQVACDLLGPGHHHEPMHRQSGHAEVRAGNIFCLR